MKIDHQIISVKANAADFTITSQSTILAKAGDAGWELVQVLILSDDVWFYCRRVGEAAVVPMAAGVAETTKIKPGRRMG